MSWLGVLIGVAICVLPPLGLKFVMWLGGVIEKKQRFM
jgi:hypothetical protein